MSEFLFELLRPQPTGGIMVAFKEGVETDRQISILENNSAGGVLSYSAGNVSPQEMLADKSSVTSFNDIGIALIDESEDTEEIGARLENEDAMAEIRPEFWMHGSVQFEDTTDRTWGVAATGADGSNYSGKGINVCVLDTGIDAEHPDYLGRSIVSESFVTGESPHDGHGHGTHCAGSATGKNRLINVPRYGVAPNANLYIGKVLNNANSGRERDIVAGMLWGVNQGCDIISVSIHRRVQVGEPHSLAYERAGKFALDNNALIVSIAGNFSSRKFGHIAPVAAPGNSPSIMAVAALDRRMDIADFSCGGINPNGGEVDIAAPGVDVFSSAPRPRLYQSMNGTSMACPHVSGLAALWAESDPSLRGRALWEKLIQTAEAINLPARDVGAGLAKAPSADVS